VYTLGVALCGIYDADQLKQATPEPGCWSHTAEPLAPDLFFAPEHFTGFRGKTRFYRDFPRNFAFGFQIRVLTTNTVTRIFSKAEVFAKKHQFGGMITEV
jgi:hypothetical protein